MKRKTNSIKGLTRIKQTIGLIEENLSNKLDLSTIAESIDLSPYHLHRLFAQMTGLTIHDYVSRRRLTHAANLIMATEWPIIEIALEAGYESQQAFTRIFRKIYKLPPAQFRKTSSFYPLQLPYDFGPITEIPKEKDNSPNLNFAEEKDISDWMQLVRLVVDGYPFLNEKEHLASLKAAIANRSALIIRIAGIATGIMIYSPLSSNIDFIGIHPLFRRHGIARLFLQSLIYDLPVDSNFHYLLVIVYFIVAAYQMMKCNFY